MNIIDVSVLLRHLKSVHDMYVSLRIITNAEHMA